MCGCWSTPASSVAEALRQISFRLVADDDQFMTIAKFRAARQLWARVAEVLGEPDSGTARLHAVTSAPMMTQRDPWVNMLRTTLAAFGAGVGGADTVQVLPFDVAIPGGYPGIGASFSRRIARNTQLLLLEESHLGRVLDPAGGSWYVEDLTESLAAQAWSNFQEIEARGGFVEARDHVAEQIEQVRARRADDIAHRRTAITGVNEYPEPGRTAAGARRRRTPSPATRPGSRRCATAPTPTWNAPVPGPRCCCCRWDRWPSTTSEPPSPRTCWPPAESKPSTREPSTPPGWPTRCAAAGAAVALICGTDARYGSDAAGVVAAARAAGVEQVLLAGPEKAVADLPAESPARRLSDRENRCGRSAFVPAHPIGGMTDMTQSDVAAGGSGCTTARAQLRRRPAARRRAAAAPTEADCGRHVAAAAQPTGTRPISSTGRPPRASPSSRSTSAPTATRWRPRATRWTAFPASRRSCAARTRRCTSTSRGPSASTPGSPPPRSPTPSTAATWPPARRACRSPSTWPPTAATTPTTRGSPATSAWPAWRSTRSRHAPAVRRHHRSTGCRCR